MPAGPKCRGGCQPPVSDKHRERNFSGWQPETHCPGTRTPQYRVRVLSFSTAASWATIDALGNTMNLLPIVERELRLASLKWGTYWSRVWIGLLGVAGLGDALLITRVVPITPIGMPAIFQTVRFFALIYCLTVGVRLTADCVSREKRAGTLGFLFLTPLRGYDVILGKLISQGIRPMYKMLVIVPMVWFMSLVGGISAGEQLYTVIALGNALFFSLAVGIAVSTFFTDRRRCELVASAAVFALFFGLCPFLDQFVHSLVGSALGAWTSGSSPVNYLVNRVNTFANPAVSGMLGNGLAVVSNAVVLATSWGLIVIASWWAPRCWQERPPAGARLSRRQRWAQWCFGSPHTRAIRRAAALEKNPFFWRATRNRLRPLIPWLFIVLTFGLPLLVVVTFGFSPPVFYALLVFVVVFWYLAPKLWIAREAARTLSEERSAGTLEMVLATPLSVREIIRGQWLGLRKCYLPAVIFALVLSVTLIILINFAPKGTWLSDIPYATPVLITGTILFLADCVAMGWVGMWTGLKFGNAKKATSSAGALVIIVPMAFFAATFFAVVLLSPLRAVPGGSLYVPIGLWLVIGLVCDFLLIKSSRHLLHREFRTVVEEPALARDAWARALGRWSARLLRRTKGTRLKVDES